jgi:hypothetical protein
MYTKKNYFLGQLGLSWASLGQLGLARSPARAQASALFNCSFLNLFLNLFKKCLLHHEAIYEAEAHHEVRYEALCRLYARRFM